MTYLVLGGLGANGSMVVKELVAQGEKPVVFDLSTHTGLLGDAVAKKVKMVRGDITNFNQLLDTIRNDDVDHIIHMVWRWSHGEVSEDPDISFRVNLLGTYNVLEAARILDVHSIVFTSSWRIYARSQLREIPEDYPKEANDIYVAGKLAVENWGKAYADSYGLDFIALRSPTFYGPGRFEMYSGGSYPGIYYGTDLMLVNALRGKPTRIDVSGRGGEERSQLLYTKDLANAVLLASTRRGLKSRAYNVGSDDYFSIREIAQIIQQLVPSAKIDIVPAAPTVTVVERGLNYARIRQELGYQPKFNFENALKDFIKEEEMPRTGNDFREKRYHRHYG